MSEQTRRLAGEFIVFCDGAEEAGLVDYARRGRVLARELISARQMLEAEQSARRSLQARCEAQQELLGKRVWDAIDRSTP